jgi:subtilisin family serine protease
MDPLDTIKLRPLMDISRGISEVVIGLIDGPVDFSHVAFRGAQIRTVSGFQLEECRNSSGMACVHGTFVAGILSSFRGTASPSICPSCSLILRPIFADYSESSVSSQSSLNTRIPSSTAEELSRAIIEVIDAGAKIVNLSIGLSTSSLTRYNKLKEAYDYALQRDVIMIVAAGNQGNIGNVSLTDHSWIIPIAACDEYGQFSAVSNFGPSIGKRGLMAPGVNIESTSPGGGYSRMSGTSFAAPFVTGAIALLWSIFPKATAPEIIHSIITASQNRRSIIPPLLNSEAAWKVLGKTIHHEMTM